MNASDFLRPFANDFDFESLRFPGEDVLRQQIQRRPAALEMIRRWCSLETCHVVPKGAHPDAFASSPAAVPALAQMRRMLQVMLRLDDVPEIVAFPSGESFIGSLASDPRRPYRVVVSSAALQRMGVREAMFQIGRRLAWRILDHFPLLGDPTAGVVKPDRDALMIRGLWKFQELTCDRIGLLCCRDFELASRSILRFASGLPDDLLQIDWEPLLAERIGEEEAMLADSPYQFALLRVAALRQFAKESTFAEYFAPSMAAIESVENVRDETSRHGVDESTIIDAVVIEAPPDFEPDAQAKVEAVVEESHSNDSQTDESAIDDGLDDGPLLARRARSTEEDPLREFSLWGALWVIGVNSAISETARAEMWEFFGSEAAAAIDEAGNHDGDERCARRCATAAISAIQQPLERRQGALEDVIHLALAAGPIAATERERIGDLAELLDLEAQQFEEWSEVSAELGARS